jgi:aryl-alcohol dehydrogenase-like predicted oxidoreductase
MNQEWSTSSVAHLEENVGAAGLELSDVEFEQLAEQL